MIVRFTPKPETLADLQEQLGGIPLHRIRANPAPGTATEADLLKPHGPICELIDGVLVEKPMGDLESMFTIEVSSLIRNHVRAGKLGVVLGPDALIHVGPDQLRGPDVTFIPWSSLPGRKLPKEAYWSVAPGLIVEVLSPHNTKAEIDRKLKELFAIRCRLAWVIDPAARTARVHTSPKRFKVIDESGTLDGGKVLPGFKLALAELFATADPPEE